MEPARVVAIVGATASGKTRAAVEAARACGGVVVSADARQAYRGLDAATGKEGEPASFDVPGVGPTPSRVVDGVHQVALDLAPPEERLTAARWHALAARFVDAFVAAGRPVVVAGGTGLYVEALLRGFSWPDTREEVRARYRHLPRREARLAELEVLGQKPSAQAPWWAADCAVIGIAPDLAAHRVAIEARVAAWFASGALQREVERLPRGVEAATAIGYEEARRVADGTLDLDVAVRRTVARTWTYARRQRAFFRKRFPEAQWCATPAEAARLAARALGGPSGAASS